MTGIRPGVAMRNRLDALIEELRLPAGFEANIDNIYLPLSRIILDEIQQRPILVSINGTQGSGKSTMTRFLKDILEEELQTDVAVMSLDDFYLRRDDRVRLAETVHPLLQTRGVPGTHELPLLESVLDSLSHEQPCRIPVFDKATDDRKPESDWITIDTPGPVILFEGWCNNSPVQEDSALVEPVNELERDEDADATWRRYVNQQLKDYHDRIFGRTDLCVMLRPPDFECVYRWRSLQEQKLRDASEHNRDDDRVMDDAQLKRFIQHYERLTRHSLQHLPAQADVVIPVDAEHRLTGIKVTDRKG